MFVRDYSEFSWTDFSGDISTTESAYLLAQDWQCQLGTCHLPHSDNEINPIWGKIEMTENRDIHGCINKSLVQLKVDIVASGGQVKIFSAFNLPPFEIKLTSLNIWTYVPKSAISVKLGTNRAWSGVSVARAPVSCYTLCRRMQVMMPWRVVFRRGLMWWRLHT